MKCFEDLKSDIGDLNKHFDNEVFLDFNNIAEEKQMMIYCSVWDKELMKKKQKQSTYTAPSKRRRKHSAKYML